MKFLFDADDDWQEGFRRYWYPRIHAALDSAGDRLGIPLYAVGTTDYNQYVGTVSIDEEVLEEELIALKFERNPIACFKSLPDGRESEGSWVLRSHDDDWDRLERDRQLHVTMFARTDGKPGRELYAHEEQDWQDDPVGHLRGKNYQPEAGAKFARELLDSRSFVVVS
jgi:hypothetical protein